MTHDHQPPDILAGGAPSFPFYCFNSICITQESSGFPLSEKQVNASWMESGVQAYYKEVTISIDFFEPSYVKGYTIKLQNKVCECVDFHDIDD